MSGQARVHGGGGKRASPPLKIEKKNAVRGNFNLVHLCFTNEIRGDRHTLHTCKMEGGGRTGACPWWEEVGALPPPPENEKKLAVRGSFNLFHLCFTNYEIRGGGSIHYTCKMEGGGRTVACPWWEGVGALPPPPENEKRKVESQPISAMGDK